MMKIGEFKKHLASFCKILEKGGAETIAGEINHLTAIFNDHEAMMVAKFVKLATSSETIQKRSEGHLLSELLEPLDELENFLMPCSKQPLLKDLKLFLGLLKSAKNTTVIDFVEAVSARLVATPSLTKRKPVPTNTTLVDKYVKRLKAAYKDVEIFKKLYEELKEDRAVRKQEAAAISDEFAYKTPPSTAKKVSLERIFSVHEYYYSSVRREKAMAGRSAA